MRVPMEDEISWNGDMTMVLIYGLALDRQTFTVVRFVTHVCPRLSVDLRHDSECEGQIQRDVSGLRDMANNVVTI